jgi:hypothetical protein
VRVAALGKRRPPMWSTVAAILLFAAAAVSAAPASADETDDAYIAALQRHGIPIKNRDATIAMGHTVCVALDQGESTTSIMATLSNAADISFNDAGFVLGASVAAYCPEYQYALDNPN